MELTLGKLCIGFQPCSVRHTGILTAQSKLMLEQTDWCACAVCSAGFRGYCHATLGGKACPLFQCKAVAALIDPLRLALPLESTQVWSDRNSNGPLPSALQAGSASDIKSDPGPASCSTPYCLLPPHPPGMLLSYPPHLFPILSAHCHWPSWASTVRLFYQLMST